MIASLLQRLFSHPPKRPACLLTETEALAIARTAVDTTMPLHVTRVAQTGAGIEWQIGTATVGSGWTVRIDDASGAVIECRRWGVR
jgi:hypothetical protein